MGTRSLLTFVVGDVPWLTIYRQYDGYLDGRGKQLAEFMSRIKLVDGYGADARALDVANGAGCLMAQWLAAEKNRFYEGEMDFSTAYTKGGPLPTKPWDVGDSIGNVYVDKPTMWPDKSDCWIEYFYHVILDEDKGTIQIGLCDLEKPGKYVFLGTPAELLEFIEADRKAASDE
jgi:hypothetical protein